MDVAVKLECNALTTHDYDDDGGDKGKSLVGALGNLVFSLTQESPGVHIQERKE